MNFFFVLTIFLNCQKKVENNLNNFYDAVIKKNYMHHLLQFASSTCDLNHDNEFVHRL